MLLAATPFVNAKSPRGTSLSTPDERIEQLGQYAALWSEPDAEEAAASVDEMLAIDSTGDEAFAELEGRHVAAERWEPLIELYLSRLESRKNAYERADLLRRIARVFEDHLADDDQALDALMNALREEQSRDTARHVERLARQADRWTTVLQTFVDWLRDETDPAQQVRFCLYLAKWYGDDLGHPEHAQPYYARIIQLDPNNIDAMRQLACLYRKAGNWKQMGTTLLRALEVAVIDVDRKELMTEVGELLDLQMHDTDRGLAFLKQATLIDPCFLPALDHLARIYTTRQEHKELADVLEQQVKALDHPTAIALTKLQAAGLYESSLGDPTRAARLYREVVDADPANVQGLRGLARIYETLGQWADVVRALEALLDVVTTGRERIDLLLQLASVQEEHFLKADVAALRLEQVLEIDPNDMGAYFDLERNYRKRREWYPLIATYERRLAATLERKARIGLIAEIAKVYADELGAVDKAIDSYRTIVELDDTSVPALEALAKIFEGSGDTARSIKCMTRVALLTPDAKPRAEALYRIGKATEEKLGDSVAARERYEQALDLDPTHMPTLAALRQMAVNDGDFEKAARHLDVEQSIEPASRHRAKLLVELAKLRDVELGDHPSAVLVWEAALEADPESEESALPLADEYVAMQEWAKAEPLLERLVRKASRRDRREKHDLHQKLGRVYAALGKHDKAAKAYGAAHELDLSDRTTTLGLADACLATNDLTQAHASFAKVLMALGDDEPLARADVHFKLGCIKREQGRAKQAVHDFERALSVVGTHRPSLDALVALYTALKDWKSVAAYKKDILPTLVDENERFALLSEIADVWSDNAKEPAHAVEALEEARKLQPTNVALLHRMLGLLQATESWTKAIEIIDAITKLEKDPVRRGKLLFTIGQIYRDELHDADSAVTLFDDALDANPTYLEAFERINKILTAKKDWKGLERAFRKMLRRLSVANAHDADLEYTLWHTLGLIYRDRLKDITSAIEAFKMATRFKPEDALERQILAELYERTDNVEGAASEHTIVLQNDPLRVDPYRSLCQLYLRQKDYDRAWCACAALAVLRKADDEERRFYEDYRPHGLLEVKSRLVNEHWLKFLSHKDEDLFIGKIMEMITPAAIVAKTTQLRASSQLPVLQASHRHDPATSTLPLAQTFGWAAQVLGVTQPALYVRDDVPGAFAAVASVPPATIAGRAALTGFTPQETAFVIGKHLAYYRGEHYIRNLFSTLAELKVLFFAAVKMVIPDFAVPGELVPAVSAAVVELGKYMQPIQREGLRMVVQRYVAEGAKADLRRWMQTTEITASRAGLLLCGDLETARKFIATEAQFPGDLPPQEKLKELIVFSVSEQYAALRAALGVGIVVPS